MTFTYELKVLIFDTIEWYGTQLERAQATNLLRCCDHNIHSVGDGPTTRIFLHAGHLF